LLSFLNLKQKSKLYMHLGIQMIGKICKVQTHHAVA